MEDRRINDAVRMLMTISKQGVHAGTPWLQGPATTDIKAAQLLSFEIDLT